MSVTSFAMDILTLAVADTSKDYITDAELQFACFEMLQFFDRSGPVITPEEKAELFVWTLRRALVLMERGDEYRLARLRAEKQSRICVRSMSGGQR